MSTRRTHAKFTTLCLIAATLTTGQFAVGQGVATYFNRNIPTEAHGKMKTYAAAGHKIICVAFPPAGGNRWSLVTDKTFFNRNVPTELHNTMVNYWKAGHRFKCVAFPPAGGNSWTLITDRTFLNRNVPTELHSKMLAYRNAGHKLQWVAYPPAGGNRWSLMTDRTFFNRGVPSALHSKMLAYHNAGHRNTCVAFPKAGGNRWSMLTNKGSFYNWGVPSECHRVMRAMTQVPGGPLQMVAFDPDGNGFSIASKASPTGLPSVITYGSEVFSIDKFCKNLKSSLSGKGVKYGLVVRYGSSIRSFAWGAKRTSYTPPYQDFTIYDRFNPASVTKVVTGIAVLRAMQNRRVGLLDKIYKYLPSFWYKPASVRGITFQELLSHTSGFRNGAGYDYDNLKNIVAAGVSTANKGYSYQNVNYAIARIVCAYLNGYNESGVTNHGLKTSNEFIAFVQRYLMNPCGAPSVKFKPDAIEPTLFFPFPAGRSPGTTYGDWSLTAGSAGVNISLAELVILLDKLRNSSTILNPFFRTLMNTYGLGWDRGARSTKNGTYHTKGGGFPGSYNRGAELRSYVFSYSSGIQVAAVINGYVGIAIDTAYQNAWSPQIVSISSVTPSLPNVTAASVLVTGQNVHLTKVAYFGTYAITSKVYTDPTRAYFRVLSSTKLLVHPPQGLNPGTYGVKIYSGSMTSNTKNVSLTKATAPTLLTTPTVTAGSYFTAWTSKGNKVAPYCWLAVSPSNKSSLLPGIFEFGIGDNFNLLLFWPLSQTFSTTTGATKFNLPSLAMLKGQTWYFQTLNATPTFPLGVSNVSSVVFR